MDVDADIEANMAGPIWIDIELRFQRRVFQLGFVLVARTAGQIDNQMFAATESHTQKGTTTLQTVTLFFIGKHKNT